MYINVALILVRLSLQEVQINKQPHGLEIPRPKRIQNESKLGVGLMWCSAQQWSKRKGSFGLMVIYGPNKE